MSEKADVLLAEQASESAEANGGEPLEEGEQSLPDSDELRALIASGRERGYLTFEELSQTLEEVEVTKEQVKGLHAHLIEHGVEADRVHYFVFGPDDGSVTGIDTGQRRR